MNTECRAVKGILYPLAAVSLALFIAGCVPLIDSPRPAASKEGYGTAQQNPATAAQILDDAAKSLSAQLGQQIAPGGKRQRIAILAITDLTGKAGPLPLALRESLRKELFQSGKFDVVADNDMERALRELKLNEKLLAAIDKRTVKQVGELLAAEAIVDGRITDSISHFQVNCELIPVAVGTLSGVAEVRIPIEVLRSSGARQPSRNYLGTLYIGGDWLETRLESVSLYDEKMLRAVFTFTNRTGREVNLHLVDPQRKTYATDESGNSFNFIGAEGTTANGYVTIRGGTKASVSIIIEGPRQSSRYLTLRSAWSASGDVIHGVKEFTIGNIPAANP